MYDIVGDIHGHGDRLELLLAKMGYTKTHGVWGHSERTLIFLGDLIDRGPYEKLTVDIARSMVEAGNALAIMGNHEFNAVAWATQDSEGGYLRPHNDKNRKQHEAFLREAEADPTWYESTIEWFKSLPLYLDLPEFRVVHACWHQPSIQILEQYTNEQGSLKPEAWAPANTKAHELFEAIETLCKGWELKLPEGYSVKDFAGYDRTAVRTKWWLTEELTLSQLAMGVPNPEALPDIKVSRESMPGYDLQKPLFIGHYWLRGEPTLLTSNIACLDWSVAQDGPLVAYRWNESKLSNKNFIQV